MTERKSGMTAAQMEAILDEAFRVAMAKYFKSKNERKKNERDN